MGLSDARSFEYAYEVINSFNKAKVMEFEEKQRRIFVKCSESELTRGVFVILVFFRWNKSSLRFKIY